jgi:parallel beta-helix repeat protein
VNALKKHALVFIVSLSLFCVFSFNIHVFPVHLALSASENSHVIHVPLDFMSIQAAVDNASSEDTISVAPGTYTENLVISKSIAIVGGGIDATIIDGSNVPVVISVGADNVTIEDLTVMKSSHGLNDVGISVENSALILISNVRVTNVSTGIGLRFCTNSVFSNNVVDNNTIVGITCYFSGRTLFSRNLVYGNTIGIVVYTSSGNSFVANTLSNNEQGMSIAAGSRQNYFFHNNFENFVSTDQSLNAQNIWSRNGEGNFWVGYTGTDANGDGIGDIAYDIDANNNDEYPLMGPFSEFRVVANGTYFVDVTSNSTISSFRYETGRETGNNMITFNAAGQTGGTGFARMMIPTSLMTYPFTIVTNEGQASGHLLSASNQTNAYLYFTYNNANQTVTVSSSNDFQLYSSLLDKYNKLQTDFNSLNTTYQSLLTANNETLQALLNNYERLLENFTQLQDNYLNLNSSFQQNLTGQSETAQNMRSLTYGFAALTAAFLITIAYLSTRFQTPKKTWTARVEEHD